jgi:hypothetical protein
VIALSPADFGKFIADETEKWAKVVKFSGANAALRDFDPAYDRNGSPSFDQPRRPETLRTAGTIPR